MPGTAFGYGPSVCCRCSVISEGCHDPDGTPLTRLDIPGVRTVG
ncbi:hypothetical protein [Streptomyces sp. NPDC004134]